MQIQKFHLFTRSLLDLVIENYQPYGWIKYNLQKQIENNTSLHNPNTLGNPRETIPNLCPQVSAPKSNLFKHKLGLQIT